MKTQINSLRSGRKNQMLNPIIDYSRQGITASSGMPSGSNIEDSESIWQRVAFENPEHLTIRFLGEVIKLTANWSLSKKSVSYHAHLDREFVKKNNLVVLAKNELPCISVQNGNIIEIGNGKNSYVNVCPSFIEIL